MHTSVPLLILCSLTLGACSSQPPAATTTDTFELRNASDGKMYRIDRRTGKTVVLDGTSFKEVPEPGMPQLVVGRVYRAEDGKASYKYLGEGRFERWGLDRYNIPETSVTK